MKRTISHITIFIMLALALGSCTHNNGDIGPWFGTWHVESITAGGTPVSVEGDYFFQFQNRLFRVSHVGARYQMGESYGLWRDEGNGTLCVTFPDPVVFYVSMPGLESYNSFTVATSSSRDVTFTKADTTGTIYCYRLHRQP